MSVPHLLADRARKPGARRAWLAYVRSVNVGMVVVVNKGTGRVGEITDYPVGTERPGDCTIRPDWHARRWSTTGGVRWVGWHPAETPDVLPLEMPQETP